MRAFLDILLNNQLIYPNTVGYNWKQDKIVRLKGHPYYHYLETNYGEGIIEIEGQKIILNEDNGILIPPFTPHVYYANEQKWNTNFITLCGLSTTFFPKLLGSSKYYLLHSKGKVEQQIIALLDALDNQEDTNSISLHTYNIFLKISQQFKNSSSNSYEIIPIQSIIKKEIDDNYMIKLHIGELSQKYHISTQYLIKIFKKSEGITPYQYLVRKRIHEAQALLLSDKNLLIADISHSVGFESINSFTETFKNYTGFTPTEFKKVYHQGCD